MLDENASRLTLSNGSTITCVPASVRQIRSRVVDLLILDETAFLDEEIWTAGRYTIIARPGSRVVMASTPYGRPDRFFAVSYRAGLAATRVDGYESFHWPSTASPLVDLLETWRRTSTEREYRREVLAEWVDDAGAYFAAEELDAACCDYPLCPPEEAQGRQAVAGVDWGFASDANALVLLAADDDLTRERDAGGPVYGVPWLEEAFRTSFAAPSSSGWSTSVIAGGAAPPGAAATPTPPSSASRTASGPCPPRSCDGGWSSATAAGGSSASTPTPG